MTTPTMSADDAAAVVARGALRLTRGITATWWYTFSAVVFFEAMLVLVWMGTFFSAGWSRGAVLAIGIGGLVWWASTLPLLFDYRHRTDADPLVRWHRVLAPMLVAVAYGVLAGVVTGIWVIALLPVVQSLVLLNWPPGVRIRMVLAATLLLAGLCVVDARVTFGEAVATDWWLLSFFSVVLPAMTVLSLWWWDVLITLDRARASEARLAATQERLRVATDVHDLQGHHLQVIALQLELAERLMQRDPDTSLEQLRAARASVDEARQGTRDLALRFRSVPLRDELANAVDLLRAAGIAADASVDRDADQAPAGVLGPVIRETTTNVLRHGGGGWARLSLSHQGPLWRYEISNDASVDVTTSLDGAGLEGLARRATDAGGRVDVMREKQQFTVVMTVPAGAEDPR